MARCGNVSRINLLYEYGIHEEEHGGTEGCRSSNQTTRIHKTLPACQLLVLAGNYRPQDF